MNQNDIEAALVVAMLLTEIERRHGGVEFNLVVDLDDFREQTALHMTNGTLPIEVEQLPDEMYSITLNRNV